MSNNLWVWRESKIQLSEKMPNGNEWPKLSIVTPSYNQGEYIEETIRSVIMQGYPNLEYIIIDGGSTDNSVDIIKKYESQLKYWISEPDNGQTHAINKGLARATGYIIAYINSDDLYMPYTFKTIAELMNTFNLQWLTGWQTRLLGENVISPKRNGIKIFSNDLFAKGYHIGSLFGWNQQCSTFWTSQLLKKAGGVFDEKFEHAMDIDMWIRFSKYSELTAVEATLAMMRLHPDQKSRNINKAASEIEAKRKFYGIAPYIRRKWVYFMLKTPVLRFIIRRMINTKGRYIVWDAWKMDWKIMNGYVK